MSVDIERTLILERKTAACDVLPESHLLIYLQDDGDVLLSEQSGDSLSIIILSPSTLDAIAAARAKQMMNDQQQVKP